MHLTDPIPFIGFGVGWALLAGMLELYRRQRKPGPLVSLGISTTQIISLGLGMLTALHFGTDATFSDLIADLRAAMNTDLGKVAGTELTPTTIVTVLVVFLLSWWISKLVGTTLVTVLTRNKSPDETGTIAALARLAQYAVMGVGVSIGLDTLGLDLGALFAAGAVFAVGIGFAMQQIAENFVSGVILLVERSIRPGDILELDGQLVRITNMGIRSTVARTLDDEEIILPNTQLVQNAVKNLRLSDPHLRVRVPVGVAYDSDLRKTLQALERAANKAPKVEGKPPQVMLLAFGSSSVDFEVSIWTDKPWMKPQIHSDLAFHIWDALHEDDIVIAFPQLDVHLDEPVVSALKRNQAG